MSTFFNPSMQQYYASQGFAPPGGGGGNQAYASGMQSGGFQGGYQPGSQNSMVGSGAMNPYMLDTFGHGQYYQPYGLAQQASAQGQANNNVPQQPYYHVPTEYIPEGTPGLDQQPP